MAADDIDQRPLQFGKHRGRTPEYVCDQDPAWLVWAYEHVAWQVCSRDLYLAAMAELDEQTVDRSYQEFQDR